MLLKLQVKQMTANNFCGNFPTFHISQAVKSLKKQMRTKMDPFISLFNVQHIKLHLTGVYYECNRQSECHWIFGMTWFIILATLISFICNLWLH
jgi:hypothetical protein